MWPRPAASFLQDTVWPGTCAVCLVSAKDTETWRPGRSCWRSPWLTVLLTTFTACWQPPVTFRVRSFSSTFTTVVNGMTSQADSEPIYTTIKIWLSDFGMLFKGSQMWLGETPTVFILLWYFCACVPKSDLYSYITKYVYSTQNPINGLKTCSLGANAWDTVITIIRLIQISDYYGHVNRLSDAAQTHSGPV